MQRRSGDGSPADTTFAFPNVGFHHGFGLAAGDDGTVLLVYSTDLGIVGRFLGGKAPGRRRAVR